MQTYHCIWWKLTIFSDWVASTALNFTLISLSYRQLQEKKGGNKNAWKTQMNESNKSSFCLEFEPGSEDDYSPMYDQNEKQTWQIHSTHLPLTTRYFNIGIIYEKIGKLWASFSYYEKAFDIQTRSLSCDHQPFVNTNSNKLTVYSQFGQHSQVIRCAREAAKIAELSWGQLILKRVYSQEMILTIRENRW